MKWFKDCTTIEEVKKQYKKLAFQYHPDITKQDTTVIMAEINSEYEKAAAKYKNVHKNAAGETYEKETADTAAEFKDIIEKVIHFQGVVIEVCGAWLWISGNTKEYKAQLKELKFKWSPNKAAWYYHNEPYKKRRNGKTTLDEIREMYGSNEVYTKRQTALSV